MNDFKDDGPPSFDDLEPEGGLSTPHLSPEHDPREAAAFRQLSYIEEDFLDDVDSYDEEEGLFGRTTDRTTLASRRSTPRSHRKAPPNTRHWQDFEEQEPSYDSLEHRAYLKPTQDKRAAWLNEDEKLMMMFLKRANSHPELRASFISATVPLMLRAHPHVYRALSLVAPRLIDLATRHKQEPQLFGKLKLTVNSLAARAAKGQSLSDDLTKHIFERFLRKEMQAV